MSSRLDLEFYSRDAVTVARELLGMHLVYAPASSVRRVARIVETEAYCGPEDRACHASRGLTRRTKTLLGPAGHAYVYLIYGMYDCFNVVCGGEGERGHAVLVRGVEPIEGLAPAVRCDGPGKSSRALGITRALDGTSLLDDSLHLVVGSRPRTIRSTARVGVAYAGDHAKRRWRFFDAESDQVSRPPMRTIGLGEVRRRAG